MISFFPLWEPLPLSGISLTFPLVTLSKAHFPSITPTHVRFLILVCVKQGTQEPLSRVDLQ